jgi:hypothetical protein
VVVVRAMPGCGSESGPEAAPNGTQASDAGSDGGTDGAACIPVTCGAQGAECGSIPDGCGSVVQCGACLSGTYCGGAGPNRCGTEPCSAQAEVCGNGIDDNCSGLIDEGCAVVGVQINGGDCTVAMCPEDHPYPVGCDVSYQTTSGGCVAHAPGHRGLFFYEGDNCCSGSALGLLRCSSSAADANVAIDANNCVVKVSGGPAFTYASGCASCPASLAGAMNCNNDYSVSCSTYGYP